MHGERAWWKAALVALGVLALLGAIGVWQLRRWLRHAIPGEPRNVVGAIVRGGVGGWEREQPDGSHRLCPSVHRPVPADGPHSKYQSRPGEWSEAGFDCLRVDVTSRQYCQYGYEADAYGFVAWGRCDLDEDGVLSEYRVRGRIVAGEIKLAPIEVTNEGE